MIRRVCAAAALAVLLCGCARNQPNPSPSGATPAQNASPTPGVSQAAQQGIEMIEEPVLDVYVVSEKAVRNMSMEEYLQGVLAGEMQSDWPLEALKAQAIIARTYAMKFLEDRGKSKYEGADISTDIEEAQAYNAEGINDRIKQAIDQTRGEVITYNEELIYTWFFSHAGGKTALAVEGLEYEGGDQPYIQSVESKESEKAPEDVRQWTATFTAQQIKDAAKELGFTVSDVSDFAVGEKGGSGRAVTFLCGGQSIPAASFRVKIGADKLRSTSISNVSVEGDAVTLSGTGYGHGVGMSQWGAYEMAEGGAAAEDIVAYYYKDISIEKMWN